MEAVNGVSDVDKGGPPPPSPLTGCYLLIVIGEPHCNEHKDIILQKVAKGLLSWDVNDCLVDLEKELAIITEQALEGEEARYGERLIQFASENLVTEILIHPVVSTLAQCVRNLLSSFTRHRHIIHAGYTFANNGSWILQDGTFSLADFSEAFQEIEVLRVIRAYENGISLHIHCAPEGDWTRLPKEPFTKSCKVRVNPNDVLTAGSPKISSFINYLQPFLIPAELESILESSDVVGNIRFSRPTLYVFPGGQGDAALFGINGFNMLLDGGFSRKACFWDFVRHLDRLDAVLLTRLNNSNVNGISAVLRRKKQNAVYPQIGHFFCNIQERKAILSPDGDKDKDPLLINLLEEGQEIVSNLRHLSLTPQVCYRDSEPINLYHKVGHGTLDMYVLSPAKDSKEVREFLQKWNNNDQKLFANQKSIRDFVFPLQNLVSICALLVWQPANPEDTITRILFPGSSPQSKIFEGLDKIKNLEFIKHPVCSEKSLVPASVIKTKQSVLDKILAPEKKPPTDNKKEKPKPETIENDSMGNGEVHAEKEKVVKKSDSTESEKSISKPRKTIENGGDKVDKPKPKPKEIKPKARSDSQQRKLKTAEKKPSPTTPKKTVDKVNGEPKPKLKASPSATPAKSTKEANNRKVVESKKTVPKKETTPRPAPDKKESKPERKPISRRPKDVPKLSSSPSKKVNGVQKPDSISKRSKLDKEGTTDSSTVSTPSADQDSILKKDISKLTPEEIQNLKAQELADLKEEQEAVKEIEAVFRKSELQQEKPSDFRKIKDLSIDDKLESEEYLIIEKTEIEPDASNETKEDETQKMARDSEESEKQRKLSGEIQSKETEVEQNRVEIEDEVQKIITSASDIVKAKDEVIEASKEVSATSPEDKIDISIDKKDNENEIKETAPESLPDEKGSANIESGATTTAPTLPEDERMPLDEIKEDNGDQVIEEKHVKENTKEKDIPVIQLPPKTFENISKLPPVVGIRLDKQSHIRDIVKTPDEVADLPVHEEVDIDHYDDYHKTEEEVVKKDQQTDEYKEEKDAEIKKVDEVAATEEKTEIELMKTVDIEKSKPDDQKLDKNDDEVEKEDTAVILQDLNKKELSKSPDEEKDTDEHELELKKEEEVKLSSHPPDDTKQAPVPSPDKLEKEESKLSSPLPPDSAPVVLKEEPETASAVVDEAAKTQIEEVVEESKTEKVENATEIVKLENESVVETLESQIAKEVTAKSMETHVDDNNKLQEEKKTEILEKEINETKVTESLVEVKSESPIQLDKAEETIDNKEVEKSETLQNISAVEKSHEHEEIKTGSSVSDILEKDTNADEKSKIPSPEPPTIDKASTDESELDKDQEQKETVPLEKIHEKEDSQLVEEQTKVEAIDQENLVKGEIAVSPDEKIDEVKKTDSPVSIEANKDKPIEQDETESKVAVETATFTDNKTETQEQQELAKVEQSEETIITTKIVQEEVEVNEEKKSITEIVEKSEIEIKEKDDEKLQDKKEIVTDTKLLAELLPEVPKDDIVTAPSTQTPKDDSAEQINLVKEDVAIIEKIDEKLQKLKEATESEKTLNEIVTVDRKVEKVLHAEPVIITTDSNPESPMVERPDFDDKIELGRKSPKEREEDVAKIVASVAEVLKSDAPLEEFEGKIPFNIPYKSYTTELRETHITTVDSPVTDEQRSIAESVCPKTTSLSFIEEERKISSIHEEVEPQESKITKMMKESEELMKATSKIISDIKLTQPKDEEDEEKEEDAGIVHRMLVTASSEDGGEETEICPPGTITFSRSSESSGRSSPDPQSSQKASQISSLADTYSEGTTVIGKTVKETVTKEIQNGLDEKVEEVKELTNGFCEKVEELKSDANEELCEIKDTVKKVIVDEHDTVLESTKTAVTSQVVEDFKNGTHIDKQETVIESIEQPKPIDIPSKVEQVEEAVKKEIVETIHSAISDKVDKETPIEKDSKLEIEDDKKAVKESSTEEKEKDTSKVVEDLKTDFGKISDPIKDTVEKSEDVTKQITTDLKDSFEEAASQVSSTQQEIKKSITTKVTEEKYDIYNGLENVEKMLVDVIMGDREDLPSPKEVSRKSSTVSVDTGESTALSKLIEKEISENKEVLKDAKDVVADTEEAVKESERIVKESRDNIENDHDVREDVLERSAQDLEKNYEIMSDMTKSIVFEKCDNAQEKEKKYQDKCEKVLELSANALEETYESTLDMAKSIVFDKCTTHEDNEESIKIKSEHVEEQSIVSAKASDDIKEEDNLKLEDPSLGVFSSGKTTPDLANIKLEDLSGKSTPDLKLIESLKNEDSCILSGKSTPDLKDSITSGKATPDLTHLKEEEFSGKSTPDLKADKQKDSIKTDDISVMSGKSTPDLKDSLASGKATPDLSHIKEELSGKSTPDLKPLDSTKTEDFSVLSGKSTPDLKDSLTSGKDTPDITSIKEEVVTGKSTPDLKDNKPTETIKSEEICVLSGKSTPDLKDSLTSGKATPDLTSIKDDNITEKATFGPKEDKQSESIKVDKDCELSGKSTPEIKEPLTSGKATPDITHIKEEAGTGKSTPDLKDNKQIESIRSEDICVLSGKSSPDLKDPLSSGKATPDLTETKQKDTVKTEESVLSGISTPDIKDSISGKTTPDPGHVTSKDVLNDESIPDHKQLESTITDISLTGKSTPDSVTTGKVTPDLHEKIEDASGKVTPTSVKNDEQSLQISGKSTPDLKESLPSGKATPDIPEKVEEIVTSGKATPTSVKIDEIGSQISGKSTPDLKDSLTSGKATPDIPEKVEETVASGKAKPTSVKIDEPCLQVSGKSTPDLKDSLTSGKATPDIPEKVEEIIASGKATPTSVKIDELCSQVSGKSTPDLKDSLTSGKATPDIPENIEDTVASGKATPTSVKIEETPLHTSEKSTPDVKDSLTSGKASPTIPEKIEDTVSSGKATPTSAKIDDQSLQTSGKSTPDLKDSLTSGKTTSDIPEKIEDAVMSETPTSMKIEQASGKVTPDVTSIKPEEELSTLSGKTTPDPKDVRKDSVHSEKSALEINDVTSVKEEVVLSEKSSTEVTIGVKGSVGEEVSLIKSGKTTPDPTLERKESVASEKSIADIKDDRKNSITSGKSTPDLKDKDRIESGKTSPDVSKTPEKSVLSGKASPAPSERKDSVLSDKVESELKEERKSSAVSEKSSPDLKVDHHQDLVDSGKSSPQPPVSGKSTPDLKDSKDSVVSGKTSPTKIEITPEDLTNDRKDSVISVKDKEDSKETAFEKDGKESNAPEKILDSKEEQKDTKPLETVSKLTEERKDSIVSGKTTPEIKESDNLKVEEQSSLVSSPGISGKSTPELKEENKDSLLSGKSSPYPIDVKELDTSIKSDSVLSSAKKEHSDRLTPDTRQGQTPSPELLSETASDKDKPTVPSSEVKDSGKSTPQLQKDEKSSSMDNLETDLEKGIQKIVPKSTSPEKGHVEKLIEEETFDMTKSIIPEVEMSQLLLDQPDASIKKLSVSDVEICIKEVTKEEPPESSVMTDSVIQHDVSKTTESTIKKDEIKAGPSSITAKSSTDEVHLSGKSTPDVAEVEKLKEIQETLKHEKHIPGSSTPPTVPVSPIVKELSSTPQPEEAKTPIKTVSSLKESEVRSYTPASDDYDIGVSTYSDISSGQVSRAPHPLETERIESDDDDDVPGSPMSITSQVAHSRSSSRYDFEDERIGSKMDPMNTSFYGALPDEPTDLDYDKALLEHRQSRGEDLVTTTEASSSYLYEVTKAKFTSSTSDLSKNDDLQLDQINKNEHQPDLMTASFMGDLPSESSSKKDPFDSWGKPLGLPSPAPPSDNRGTPKKERKLPSNVSAKNKLNDDKKRADSPSKYKNKKFSPIYVDLTYVPHHGNGFYSYVEFFKRVRARYYVFSGIEPSREVYNALLEAKQTWEDKELEVTIIPTYDTDILGYWVAENEELLTKCKIDLSPSASRCTINLQDHETSCSAYRLEF